MSWLLYTSDADDDLLCRDLRGRRNNKKKIMMAAAEEREGKLSRDSMQPSIEARQDI